jgi:hypothetical protein
VFEFDKKWTGLFWATFWTPLGDFSQKNLVALFVGKRQSILAAS